jgi:hypothetical protein
MTELDTKSPANSAYPVPAPEIDKPPDMGASVRGWLLYYCISRTILNPLVLLYSLHGLHLFRLIAIDVIEALVGLIAGTAVWRMSRRWIRAVWSDLTVRLVQVLIVAASWQITSAVRPAIRLVVHLMVFGWGLGIVLAWFLYFRTSKRVLLTLGRNL